MVQSFDVAEVILSVAEPQVPSLSVAMTVSCPIDPASPVEPVPGPVTVIMTPGLPLNASGRSCACIGSETLHVAVLPSSVIAGIRNCCTLSAGMNAEYIGEKTIPTVGFGQDPASPTVFPSMLVIPPSPLPPSSPLPPPLSGAAELLASLPPPASLPVVDAGVVGGELLLLQAANPAPSANTPAVRPYATMCRFEENCTGTLLGR